MAGPPLDDDLVRRLAALARLRIDPERVAALRRDLGRVLDYVDSLPGTDAVPIPRNGDPGPVLRERPDVPRTEEPAAGDALSAVPELLGRLVVAPGLERGTRRGR